ncbi:MAG: hypothetical protein Ct9H300mP5_2550 [Candidatus Pelagibacterales bacterium]|nr:MAG: hypothetical protein Ct9H300mP5_2550 [Pelagibacterales bacterium]
MEVEDVTWSLSQEAHETLAIGMNRFKGGPLVVAREEKIKKGLKF